MHSTDSGDCKFDIVYCIVSCCFILCVMYFLTSNMSKCCTTEFVGRRNMYLCNILIKIYCFQYKFMASKASDI